jgi:hypothetical protein
MPGARGYLRVTTARDRIGRHALAALVLVLAGLWVATLVGPPPPDVRTLAASGLAMWLVVPWGYWIDRHRAPRAPCVILDSRGDGGGRVPWDAHGC